MNLENYESVLRDLTIPPRPEVVAVLVQEMGQDQPNLERVTKVIVADPGLSAGMLRAANSPLFGLTRKLSSVAQAIRVLGFKHVANIATGLAIRHALKGGNRGQSFEQFWNGAEQTGMLCHYLARSLRGISPDEAFTYGLFHDSGIPLLIQRFPGYQAALEEGLATGDTGAEESATGTSHAILGYFLTRSWMLPDHLCQAILLHHDLPSFTDPATSDTMRNLIALGHLAEHIQQRWLGNHRHPEWLRYEEAVTNHFGLTEEDMKNLIDEAQQALNDSQS